MRATSRLISPLGVFLALHLVAGAARAQSSEVVPDPQATRRTVYGHTFIPSTIVGSPFVPTSLGSSVGFGYARVTSPNNMGGTSTSHLAALSLGVDMQVNLTDWFAVRGAARGTALSGVTGESVVREGALVTYEATAGATFAWTYRDRVRMGITLDVGYTPDYTINVRGAVDEFDRLVRLAIDRARMTGQLNLPTLSDVNVSNVLSNSQKLQFGGGWQAAVALHRFVGVFFDFRYAHIFDGGGNGRQAFGEFYGGAAVSMDFRAISPLPFGILGAYRMTVPAVSRPELTHDVAAGFFYTGRRSLLLGGEATMSFLPVDADTDLFVVSGQLVMRYFW
ncbi:MAG: hypothetical protein U0325_07195 [Polyangiales bacterium]